MSTSDGQNGNHSGAGGKNEPQQPAAESAPEAPALAVIEAFGGIRPMAKTLGLAVSTVQGWKERSAIPANRHDQIRAAARDNNIDIDPGVLRASAGEGASQGPQTIEVVAEPPAGESRAEAAAEEKPEAKADRPSGAGARGEGPKTAAAPRSSAATAAGTRRSEAPAAAGSRRGGTFLPGLVAGVVLAAAVAVATVYTQPYWAPLLQGTAESQGGGADAAVAELQARLDALEQSMPADPSQPLSAMSERVSTLEAAVSQGAGRDPETDAALESLSAELARLTDRIAGLEEDFETLRSRAGAPSEELVNRLSSEAERLDSILARQSELAARLAAAEADLDAVQDDRAAAPGGRETLLLLATLQLRDALQGSGPYADPLAMLQNLAAEDAALTPIIEPLERRATTGVPSLAELRARFPDVARRIAAIESAKEGEGWSAGVLRRLSEAVNLRPVGLVEGAAPTAVAARAEVKLNEGDLAGAVAELDALDGAAAEAAASWRADAEARLAARRAVSELGALVSRRFATMADG